MVKWMWVLTVLTTTTVTWVVEITSPLSRCLQLIMGEFSRGSSRPRVISAEEQEGRNVITFTVCLVWCLPRNTKECLLFWVASGHGEKYWKTPLQNWSWWIIVNESPAVWNDTIWAPSPRLGQPWGHNRLLLFLFCSVLTSARHAGQAFPWGRAGMHYFDSNPSLLLKWQNVQFLLECILQPSMVGHIHSHRVLIMCQTIMSQSLASHVRKLALPPLLCYSMQIGKGSILRTRSYGAGPGYCSEAT